MKWMYCFLAVLFAVSGCKQNNKYTEDDSSVFSIEEGMEKGNENEVPIQFGIKSLTEKDISLCESGDCPEITINFLQVKEPSVIADKINAQIVDFVIASLDVNKEDSRSDSIHQAAEIFVKMYRDDKNRYPDISGVYIAHIDVKEIFNSLQFVSLELSQFTYTGGAHGNGTTTFLTVSPENGNILKLKDITQNPVDFIAFAETKFKKEHQIPESENINSTGFWFDDDRFYLPDSFGVTLDNFIFTYNNYEIASYAYGPIEFKISRKEAQAYLKPEYFSKTE